jgi:hypothetical protein
LHIKYGLIDVSAALSEFKPNALQKNWRRSWWQDEGAEDE